MNVSIKNKIYLSFLLPVLLFIVTGIYTIITINSNKQLTEHIAAITEPSLDAIQEFKDLVVASEMQLTDQIFLQAGRDDIYAWMKLQNTDYPKLKQRLAALSSGWDDRASSDSLNKIFAGFERLLRLNKKIISLQIPDDANNPVIKREAKRIINTEVFSSASSLMKALTSIEATGHSIRKQKDRQLRLSSMQLRNMILVRIIAMICIGIFLSWYMTKVIITPVNNIRDMINDLGKGKIRKIDSGSNSDEIGMMVISVNKLSERLQNTAAFAAEIGNRNFNSPFKPLSSDDTLGKALINMRDNIKLSDEKLNDAQHIAHIGSWERDIKPNTITLSDEMMRIFDIDAASFDFRFLSIMNFIHPDDREFVMSTSRKNLYMPPAPYECRIITSKGIIKNIYVQTKTAPGKYAEIERTFGIVQDITLRKKAEKELEESEAFNKGVLASLSSHIAVVDETGTIIAVNNAWDDFAKDNGATSPELTSKGSNYFDACKKAMAAGDTIAGQALDGILSVFRKEKTDFELEYSCDSPELQRWFNLRVMKFNDENKVVTSHEDITERRKAEDALRESESNLQAIFENTSDGFILTDLKGDIKSFNNKAKEIFFQNSGKEISVGKSVFDFVRESMKEIYRNAIPRVLSGENMQYDLSFEKNNGEIKWFSFTINRVYSNGKTEGFSITAKDITQTKEAENTLRQSEERYRQIVETAQEGIWLVDENNITTFVNKKMADILEYSVDEMVGKENYCFMDEEWEKNARGHIVERKQGRSDNHDFKYITKGGKYVWANLSTNPVTSEDGTYIGALAMVTDITKRKLDEDLLKQSEINLAIKNKELEQKNKELEQFAFIASHDLQEPLRTTSSFVQLFLKQYKGKLDEKADRYLHYITESSDRMKVLITDLLEFSRIGSKKELQHVNCNTILHEVVQDLGKAIKETGAVIKADTLPVINGYPTELKQLFQNLVFNSIKFRQKNILPEINISAQKKGDAWQFAFADNGIGIAREYYDRIFIIFQRLHTRNDYKGSGIGLSHCKKIVELHNGKIWLQSEPGKGTTFYFTIPQNNIL